MVSSPVFLDRSSTNRSFLVHPRKLTCPLKRGPVQKERIVFQRHGDVFGGVLHPKNKRKYTTSTSLFCWYTMGSTTFSKKVSSRTTNTSHVFQRPGPTPKRKANFFPTLSVSGANLLLVSGRVSFSIFP